MFSCAIAKLAEILTSFRPKLQRIAPRATSKNVKLEREALKLYFFSLANFGIDTKVAKIPKNVIHRMFGVLLLAPARKILNWRSLAWEHEILGPEISMCRIQTHSFLNRFKQSLRNAPPQANLKNVELAWASKQPAISVSSLQIMASALFFKPARRFEI